MQKLSLKNKSKCMAMAMYQNDDINYLSEYW